MIRIGLSSTALLTFGARDVLATARAAGVDAIEWAGDIHVPHNDSAAAVAAMMETLRAGLTIASYSSLYRARVGPEQGLNFEAVLNAAASLQSPNVRVYLGDGQQNGDRADRGLLVDAARRLGDAGGRRGITVCFSLGRNTCLHRYDEAIDLMGRIAHPFVRLAWEALPGIGADQCSASLEAAGGSVALLIVRRIAPAGTVESIADEESVWRRRIAIFKKAEIDPKMAQFVVLGAVREPGPADSAALLSSLTEDVALLRRIIAELG